MENENGSSLNVRFNSCNNSKMMMSIINWLLWLEFWWICIIWSMNCGKTLKIQAKTDHLGCIHSCEPLEKGNKEILINWWCLHDTRLNSPKRLFIVYKCFVLLLSFQWPTVSFEWEIKFKKKEEKDWKTMNNKQST